MNPCIITPACQPLKQIDQAQIASILSAAFSEDPAMVKLIGKARWNVIRKKYFEVQLSHPDLILVAHRDNQAVGVITATSPLARYSFTTAVKQLMTMRRLLGKQYSDSQRIGDRIGAYLPQTPHIYINQLAVLPEFQGSGIGHSLVKDLLALNTHTDIYVDCEQKLADFYQRNGFELMGEVKDTELVVMSREC